MTTARRDHKMPQTNMEKEQLEDKMTHTAGATRHHCGVHGRADGVRR